MSSTQTRWICARPIGCKLGSLLPLCAPFLLLGCDAIESDSSKARSDFEGTKSGLTFVPARGIFDKPFDLKVSHNTAKDVRYTLDGSDPCASQSAIAQPLPLVLRVDPGNTEHRFRAPGVVVRAAVASDNCTPDAVATHSYVFQNRVVELSPDGQAPGDGWPAPVAPNAGGARQAMDYGMDPDVTESPEYAPVMLKALSALPVLSLVTELGNLFDPQRGIFANAENEGVDWERPGSIELLNQDGSSGFQANTGIRIRGGYSRNSRNPKHSFRLFFKGTYGTPKLKYPLFGSEGTDQFDKLDLRTAQNYSWSGDGSTGYAMTMTRDVFSRDLQRELGRPYTRSRAHHLYINGTYFGIYQTEERPEAKFAASYLGGSADDYDTIKPERAGSTGEVVATDGTLDVWTSLWHLCEAGFEDDASFYQIAGRRPDGSRDNNLPVLVDIDNLIDYMLVIFYTANFDGPTSKWFKNNQANNFYALRSRANQDAGFVFLAHDNEHSLQAKPITITSGIDEDRVNIGVAGGATDASGRSSEPYRMNITDVRQFSPQWLHFRLASNKLYRQRFSARAHELLKDGGTLSSSKLIALHEQRVTEIRDAIVAESARWGDAQVPNQPRTRRQDFEPAVELVRTFLTKRHTFLIEQLTKAGLY